MVEYYSSVLNPECSYAAYDGFIVAIYYGLHGRWSTRGTYVPIRDHYYKIEWNGVPFDTNLVDQEIFAEAKVRHGSQNV
jgi:hypothetical protein